MGRPVDARGWLFEVRTATTPAEAYTAISNVTSFNLNKGENEEVADTTSFDSAGNYSQDVMQRGATLELTGQYATDAAGVRNPGQAYVDDTLTAAVGTASQGRVRFRHTSQTSWVVWDATATPGEVGGETNAKTGWGVTFTRCGAATSAAVV